MLRFRSLEFMSMSPDLYRHAIYSPLCRLLSHPNIGWPAGCPCGRVHSYANVNSRAAGRVHSHAQWNSSQRGQVHYTDAAAVASNDPDGFQLSSFTVLIFTCITKSALLVFLRLHLHCRSAFLPVAKSKC